MSNPLMSMMGGNNPMMNNPIMKLVQMMKSGGNPQAMLQQMAGQNPQLNQIIQMTQGKSQSEMSQYIKSAAQQRGVDLGQLASQIGMPPEIAQKYGIELPNQ